MNITLFKHTSNQFLEEKRRNRPIQLFLKQTLTQKSNQSRNTTRNAKSFYESLGEKRSTIPCYANTITYRKQTIPNSFRKKDMNSIIFPKIIKLYYNNETKQNKPISLLDKKAYKLKPKKNVKHLQNFTKTLLFQSSDNIISRTPSFSNAITQTDG